MANLTLWEQIKELKSPKYKWVDLTHELSPETPHWFGFKPLQADLLFDYAEGTPEDMMAPMRCIQYSVASQYGTHTDVPRHFWGSGRDMSAITVQELMYPLVVIDKSAECAANPDFMLTVDDLKAWEAQYGRIPEGAFVAFRSDWYKSPTWTIPIRTACPIIPAGTRRPSSGWWRSGTSEPSATSRRTPIPASLPPRRAPIPIPVSSTSSRWTGSRLRSCGIWTRSRPWAA